MFSREWLQVREKGTGTTSCVSLFSFLIPTFLLTAGYARRNVPEYTNIQSGLEDLVVSLPCVY